MKIIVNDDINMIIFLNKIYLNQIDFEDKEKLDTLAIMLKHNLSHIREHMTIFRNYLDTKFSSLRVQCRRTPEEMVELTLYENVLKSYYPDILKYDLFGTWFSVSDIEFEVKQIDSI